MPLACREGVDLWGPLGFGESKKRTKKTILMVGNLGVNHQLTLLMRGSV